jgi:hypothetical protein
MVTIQGSPSAGYLLILGGSDAVIHRIEDIRFANAYDGCVSMTASSVFVVNSVFENCQLGMSTKPALSLNAPVSATVQQSEFRHNIARCSDFIDDCLGGAIRADSGPLTIEHSVFESNSVVAHSMNYARGGAVYAARGLTVRDSVFNSNSVGAPDQSSGLGGAIHSDGNTFIYRTAFFDNEAVGADFPAGGGAIFHLTDDISNGGLFRVWNSYFLSNRSYGDGRGGAIQSVAIRRVDARLDIRNSTFSENSALMADEVSPGEGSDLHFSGSVSESIYNSIFNSNGGLACVKEDHDGRLNGDFNLLGNGSSCDVNGAAVPDIGFAQQRRFRNVVYQPLRPDSFAIDTGNVLASDFNDPETCRPDDLFGGIRPRSGFANGAPICDIGALEYRPEQIFSDAFLEIPQSR